MLAGGALAPGFAQAATDPSPTAVSPEKTGAAIASPATTAPAAPSPRTDAAAAPSPATPAAPDHSGANPTAGIVSKSPWFYEIERLAKAGVDEGVVQTYINSTAGTFNLTADQVIYLKDLGLSPQVINTMIDHDQDLISGTRPLTAAAPPPFPPSVQAALAARLHPAGDAPAPSAAPAPLLPEPRSTIIAPDDDPESAGAWVLVEPDDVPDQPRSAGPVRVPYAVKLTDPIIVFRLPTFTVPYW
jgi:hypothetical protein